MLQPVQPWPLHFWLISSLLDSISFLTLFSWTFCPPWVTLLCRNTSNGHQSILLGAYTYYALLLQYSSDLSIEIISAALHKTTYTANYMALHRALHSFVVDNVYNVPEKPYQLHHLSFPARRFGKASPVHRSFQLVWFNRFKWIHYNVPRDAVFCHICCKTIKEKLVNISGLTEASFLCNGYTNWKDATRNFANHDKTDFRRQAVVAL